LVHQLVDNHEVMVDHIHHTMQMADAVRGQHHDQLLAVDSPDPLAHHNRIHRAAMAVGNNDPDSHVLVHIDQTPHQLVVEVIAAVSMMAMVMAMAIYVLTHAAVLLG
jgi:hypothetical protein